MYYVIQENLFREENYDNLLSALKRLGLDHEVISVPPFVDDLYFQTKRKDVFVFGSLKLSRLAKQYSWSPGSLVDDNHNYEAYSPHYKNNLLNYDSVITKFGGPILWDTPVKFIRPCDDSKVFTGMTFVEKDWDKFMQQQLTNGHRTSLTKDTPIQVAMPKYISKEIRCWVVGGKVVTASQYQLGGRYWLDQMVDPEALEFCQRMVDIHQLAPAFVMDVCLAEGEWKIVECGCINAAGFYRCDVQRLLMAIEDLYDHGLPNKVVTYEPISDQSLIGKKISDVRRVAINAVEITFDDGTVIEYSAETAISTNHGSIPGLYCNQLHEEVQS